MNGDDPELDALLSPLRDGPVSLSSGDAEEARRARILPALRSATAQLPRQRARRRLWRRVRIGSATTLALLGLLWVGGRIGSPDATRTSVQRASPEPAHVREAEVAPSEVAPTQAPPAPGPMRAYGRRGGALRADATKAKVRVAPHSRLRLPAYDPASDTELLSLLEGEVQCEVPPLARGRGFVVTTPDARVVVHGTAFRVRVPRAGQSCVTVREGLVEVQTDGERLYLGPGAQWGCDAPRAAAPRGAPTSARRAAATRKRRRAHAQPQARPETTEASEADGGTLAIETELVAEALRAEMGGRRTHAEALLRRLLAEHPASPLVPEARAALTRLREGAPVAPAEDARR